MTGVDIEDSVATRCATAAHSGKKQFYQVNPENTYSVLTAPNEKWNKILRKVNISSTIVEVEVYVPAIANNCRAGQFVIVRSTERAERIPLTIGDFDRAAGTITMVVQAVGHSSTLINSFGVGDRFLDIVGPLGHPSDIANYGTVVCIGGGVGVAPVFPIQRELKAAGNHVISIFGARNKDLVFWEDKMRAHADEVYVTTDDGSAGEKGFVTSVLQRLIDEGRKIDRVVAIGPGIMMKMVCRVTEGEPKTDAAKATACLPIRTIVSLNTIMVDGTGMCFAPGTRVRLADGATAAIEDVQPGAEVMTPAGQAAVSKVSRATGPLFAVSEATKGVPTPLYTVNGDHTLVTRQVGCDTDTYMSVSEYVALSDARKQSLRLRYHSNVDDCEISEADAALYWLAGAWCGDGDAENMRFITGAAETSLREEITRRLTVLGYSDVRVQDASEKAIVVSVDKNAPVDEAHNLWHFIQRLCPGKAIDDKIVTAPAAARTAFIGGFIASDGHVQTDEQSLEVVIKTIHQNHAAILIALAHSLSVSVCSRSFPAVVDKGVSREETWSITFGSCKQTALLALACATDKSSEVRDHGAGLPVFDNLCKFSVEPAGEGEFVGLTLTCDGSGHTFLLADGSIVHNCGGCRLTVNGNAKFACVDGPEFDGHLVDWDNLASRMGTYRAQEKMEAAPGASSAATVSKMRVPMPEQDAEYRATNFFEVALGYTEEMARAEAGRCLNCKKPRCRTSCPVSVDIPTFIKKIVEGDYHGAYDVITKNNPCPGISGRVCPQELQCESRCILGDSGLNKGAIAIGRLERFVADWVRTHPQPPKKETILHTGCRVAVVGSGPAGIAATANLAAQGHRVTVFEALHAPGGVCTYGIPQFRLPKDIVRSEVRALEEFQGGNLVEVRLNTPVGQCGSVPDLLKAGYDAVFVGTGAGLPRFMEIPGEDLPGVYSANEYLTRVNLMKAFQFPDKADTPVLTAPRVVVVGGGNVACDVARCARRFGADVTMVYRRPQSRMPARAEEIHHAIQEGIKVKEQFNPVEIIANCEGTGVKGVLAVRMDNSDGRCTPISGTEELVPCSMVVVAIGNKPNPLISASWPELETHRGGLITVNEDNMSSVPGVFAAGDIVTGAATVIMALGAGRQTAMSIHKWLSDNGKGDDELRGKPVQPGLPVRTADGDVVEAEPAAEPEEEPGVDVSSNAVHIDLEKCVGCTACVKACDSQGMHIIEMNEERRPVVKVGGTLAESGCISCGRCASVCPMGAIVAAPATERVLAAIEGPAKAKVALVAPSCKVGFAEALTRTPANGEAELISALRHMGFTHVFDVQTAADMTIVEEASELIQRLESNEKLPLLTSCCPAWVNLIEQEFPSLVGNLSSARSPNAMCAAVARKHLSATIGCEAGDIHVTAVMPCIAKKDEIRREQLAADCNEVLTVRELADHVKKAKVPREHATPGFDSFMDEASGSSVIFGTTGGVMEAALRTAARRLGVEWTSVDYTPVRGLDGVKEAEIKLGERKLRVCVAHGGQNIRTVLTGLADGSRQYDFVEGMACPGGCVGGAGMPRAIKPARLAERAAVLYALDEGKPRITSDENETVRLILDDIVGEDRHSMLHTTFAHRPKKTSV